MPVFTTSTCREAAAKSLVVRRRRKELNKIAADQAEQAALQTLTLRLTDPLRDQFTVARLVRVRKQLTRLDAMMERERDARNLDRLASAQSRLAEQERLLSGRPLPGQRRPAPDRPVRVPVPLPMPLLDDGRGA